MAAYYIIFSNEEYNYTTMFNGSLEDAVAYFVGQEINFGDRDFGDVDNLQTVVDVRPMSVLEKV